jgi:hypothetical protein
MSTYPYLEAQGIWSSKSILYQDGSMSNGNYYRRRPKMTLTLAKQTQLGLVESMGLGPTSLVIISFQFSNKKKAWLPPPPCVVRSFSFSLLVIQASRWISIYYWQPLCVGLTLVV